MLLIAVFLLPLLRTALLGTCRKVLFVVASEIVQCNFVDFDATAGHLLDVLYNHLVVGVLLVVFEALGTHVAGQVVHRAGHALTVLDPSRLCSIRSTYLP